MNRGKEPLASLCERKFVLDAIKENKVSPHCTERALTRARLTPGATASATLCFLSRFQRLDGRGVYDYRSLLISPSAQQPGSVEVTLGTTRFEKMQNLN